MGGGGCRDGCGIWNETGLTHNLIESPGGGGGVLNWPLTKLETKQRPQSFQHETESRKKWRLYLALGNLSFLYEKCRFWKGPNESNMDSLIALHQVKGRLPCSSPIRPSQIQCEDP